jgi:hypothetical protein
MPCEVRGNMIICSRSSLGKCHYCGRPQQKLCDYPLSGEKAGKTCDIPMCERCATHVPPDTDYCRVHAKMIAECVRPKL